MALNEKEREQIIEEEKLRWATRLTLMEEARGGYACGHGYGRHRAFRLLFWLPVLGLIVWAVGRGACHF